MQFPGSVLETLIQTMSVADLLKLIEAAGKLPETHTERVRGALDRALGTYATVLEKLA